MSRHRFTIGARFRWKGASFEIKRLLPDQQLNLEDLVSGAFSTVALADLVQALFANHLHFIDAAARRPQPPADRTIPAQALDDYPPHLVAIARYRLVVIEPLLALDRRVRTRAIVEARVNEVKQMIPIAPESKRLASVSVMSIYRWMQDYLASDGDLRALIPNTKVCGAKDQARLAPEVQAIVEAVIQEKYLVRERVTIDDVLREVAVRIAELNTGRPAAEHLDTPGRATIARRIDALDMTDHFAAKHGKRAAKRQLTQYGQTDYPQAPLERVEIDHTRADFIVIDDQDNLPLGRLTVTYCLDVATRYPLGYYMGFEPPSYLTVLECLYHAICPKTQVRERYGTNHDWIAYGIPASLVVDNGKEFIGRDLQDACLLLGIVLQQTPVCTPEFKAGIERLFGSLNTMLFHTFPGTTFSNTRQRGDYDSLQQACVYLSDVDKLMHLFVVDLYAERFHRGLDGIPARRWETVTRFGFMPRLPASADELRILLGRVTMRVIHHYGIEFESLRYNSPDLLTLRTRLKDTPAKIKYHPGDLSRLYVHDPFEERYIEVPALAEEYVQGLSLWKHKIIRSAVLAEQDKVDLVALGQARRKIQAIVEAGRARKRTSTRSRLARWDMAGKPSRTAASDPSGDIVSSSVDPVPALPPPSSPALPIDVVLPDPSTDDGWDMDFSLPKSRRHDP